MRIDPNIIKSADHYLNVNPSSELFSNYLNTEYDFLLDDEYIALIDAEDFTTKTNH